MTNTLHIVAIWTHILGIALFVGPQFFFAFAWMPASRRLTDLSARATAMRTMVHRLAYLGGVGLFLILVAGIYLVATFRDYYHLPGGSELGFFDIRYGVVFTIKMGVLVVMLTLNGLHTFVVGPRQLRVMEAEAEGRDMTEARKKVRIQSMVLSIGALVLTLAIMVMGAMLNTVQWSLQ